MNDGSPSVETADAVASRLGANGASDADYRALISAMDQAFCLIHVIFDGDGPDAHAVDYRYLEINPAYAEQSRLRNILGRTAREVTPNVELHWIEAYGRVARTGEPARIEAASPASGGRWFNVQAFRVGDPSAHRVAVLFTDDTDRRANAIERERLLAEAEAARAAADVVQRQLLTVLEQLPVGVHVAEAPSGRLILDNAAIRAICGEAPLSERVEDYSADYVGHYPPGHPKGGQLLPSDAWPLSRALATGSPVNAEFVEIRRADGTSRLASISAVPMRDANGHLVGAVATSVDVTDQVSARREIERLLAESEETRAEVTAVLESIGDAFYAVDADFCFTYINRQAETMWKRRREDLIGRNIWREFPQTVGSDIFAEHHFVMRERLPARLEINSAIVGRWIDISLYPASGGGLACYFRDIEDRKRAERERERLLSDAESARGEAEAARERTSRLQALTEALAAAATPDEVADAAVRHTAAAFDAAGAILVRRADGDWLEIMRALDMPNDVGSDWQRFPLSAAAPIADVARSAVPVYLESRAEWTERYPHLEPLLDATGHHANAVVPVVFDGRVLGVLGAAFTEPRVFTAEDRALALAIAQQCAQALERVWLFEAEREARREAEGANRAKSEFLAVMSHELRTPLNAIGGYAELMEMGIRGAITSQQREDLRRIQHSQRHLLGLINEVLNYAKLETGTVQYALARVRVCDALTTAETLVAPQAASKGLSLIVAESPPELAVRADAEKLQQILVNLLSNAVKFTDRGGEVVLAGAEFGDEVEIVVRDTGIGIAPEQLERIFDPFVQVRSNLTRTAEGTGLGLAISRDLARGMGGNLTVESRAGLGSTFTVTLPRG